MMTILIPHGTQLAELCTSSPRILNENKVQKKKKPVPTSDRNVHEDIQSRNSTHERSGGQAAAPQCLALTQTWDRAGDQE